MEKSRGEVVIYNDKEGPKIEVSVSNDSVWLTQPQIAQLFGTQRPAVTKHFANIFKSGELKEKSVSSILEHTAADGKKYKTKFYNLDAIISVGYRVNSKRATQFRVWATERLKEYLVKGYAMNQNRLREAEQLKLKELQEAHKLIQKAMQAHRLAGFEKELLNIISEYTDTWVLLYQYDKEKLSLENVSKKKPKELSYGRIQNAIDRLKERLVKQGEAGELFGQETGSKLVGVLGNINQTFDSRALYASIEEKAAHLLYFVIKDHPFIDGNKRIGSLLFILYLIENNLLYGKNGERKINDNALVALALLVAESEPKQKDVMVKLVANLIKG